MTGVNNNNRLRFPSETLFCVSTPFSQHYRSLRANKKIRYNFLTKCHSPLCTPDPLDHAHLNTAQPNNSLKTVLLM